MGIRGELFSTKVALPNRTYFFNVKENRMGDIYLNIVESKNKETGGFDRQSVILFADDLQEFLKGFDESLRVVEKAVRDKKKPSRRSAESKVRDEQRPKRGDRPQRDGRSQREGRPQRDGRDFKKDRHSRADSRPHREEKGFKKGKRVVVKKRD